MILYRPVGLSELEQTAANGFRSFPPRAEHQPIFYAVLDRELATQIACDWNANDPDSGYAGYVLSFAVDDAFAARYPTHTSGNAQLRELWIPSDDLADLNRHLRSGLAIIEEYHGRKFSRQALEAAIKAASTSPPPTDGETIVTEPDDRAGAADAGTPEEIVLEPSVHGVAAQDPGAGVEPAA